MSRGTWLFTLAGLFVALFLAGFFSRFASSAPDGLERIAADKGFLEKGEGAPLWRHALMPNYVLKKLGDGPAATAAAGLAGTLCAFAGGCALARLIRARSKRAKARPASLEGPRP